MKKFMKIDTDFIQGSKDWTDEHSVNVLDYKRRIVAKTIPGVHFDYEEAAKHAARIVTCLNACKDVDASWLESGSVSDYIEKSNMYNQAVEALKTWQKFFDTMPKGQFGKISCDIGLMNDAFVATRKVLSLNNESKF